MLVLCCIPATLRIGRFPLEVRVNTQPQRCVDDREVVLDLPQQVEHRSDVMGVVPKHAETRKQINKSSALDRSNILW